MKFLINFLVITIVYSAQAKDCSPLLLRADNPMTTDISFQNTFSVKSGQWITTAHGLVGKTRFELVSGNSNINLRLNKIDFSKDIAILEASSQKLPKNKLPVCNLETNSNFSKVQANRLFISQSKRLAKEKLGNLVFPVSKTYKPGLSKVAFHEVKSNYGQSGSPVLNAQNKVIAMTYLNIKTKGSLFVPASEILEVLNSPPKKENYRISKRGIYFGKYFAAFASQFHLNVQKIENRYDIPEVLKYASDKSLNLQQVQSLIDADTSDGFLAKAEPHDGFIEEEAYVKSEPHDGIIEPEEELITKAEPHDGRSFQDQILHSDETSSEFSTDTTAPVNYVNGSIVTLGHIVLFDRERQLLLAVYRWNDQPIGSLLEWIQALEACSGLCEATNYVWLHKSIQASRSLINLDPIDGINKLKSLFLKIMLEQENSEKRIKYQTLIAHLNDFEQLAKKSIQTGYVEGTPKQTMQDIWDYVELQLEDYKLDRSYLNIQEELYLSLQILGIEP